MDFSSLPTPCFVVDEALLTRNLAILKDVADRSSAKILLAQKAFSMFSLYPLISRYLSGTTASGLHEARLGREEFPGEVHVFSPAYPPQEFKALLPIADHFVFNSFAQWEKYGAAARAAGKSCGIRINPECSTQEDGHAIYDPCAPGSRLGVTERAFRPDLLDGVDGLHMHTLCEQGFDALSETLAVFEAKFGKYLHGMKWLNLGGGHHITKEGYDREGLVACVRRLRETYGVEVYLEPGEAVVLNTGFLVSSVLETMQNGINIAILDASAACHMPDVLEMPYRPPVLDAGEPGEKAHTYRLTGGTCLAGDVVGDYSFDQPLREGSRVVFGDMALYTMVKTNTFNGMNLPSIAIRHTDGTDEIVRTFGYGDFKTRLS
ncbi:carboxynorspermidine decarboxylase [Intestinibacillus massiliensis]|nr:carboxynorspermidine decarboxylase [Intestinibacillus massiliensis]